MSNGGTPANRRPERSGEVRQPDDVRGQAAKATSAEPVNGHLLPDDVSWHDDKALMAELSQLNTQVTRYILRYFDADAGQAAPMSVKDERALSEQLAKVAGDLQARADRREALGTQPLTVEGDVEPPHHIADGA